MSPTWTRRGRHIHGSQDASALLCQDYDQSGHRGDDHQQFQIALWFVCNILQHFATFCNLGFSRFSSSSWCTLTTRRTSLGRSLRFSRQQSLILTSLQLNMIAMRSDYLILCVTTCYNNCVWITKRRSYQQLQVKLSMSLRLQGPLSLQLQARVIQKLKSAHVRHGSKGGMKPANIC